MQLRRLAPLSCPFCGAHKTLFMALDGHLTCRSCGHKLPERKVSATAVPVPASDTEDWRKYPLTYGITHQAELNVWARGAYESGLAYLQRNLPQEAIAAFKRALDTERDFLDAHLWLARLLPDADDKRHHYGEIVANMPNHLEAIQELMVLNGSLTREEATLASGGGGTTMAVGAPVEAAMRTSDCPVCGGEMQSRQDGSQQCRHCRYTRAPSRGDYGMKSFTMEILKRRGQKIQWEVGERLLRCGSCGAETLLTPQALTAICPFCGSKSVMETDALRSFVQPDGLLSFTVDETTARSHVDEALSGRVERFKGLFGNNRVVDMRVSGVYLPFWLYDLTLQISKTVQDNRTIFYNERTAASAYQHDTEADSVFDVSVCGVESPPRALTERLQRYDLTDLQAYHADGLADASAQLYTVDFERASLLARRRVSEWMRERHGSDGTEHVKTTVQSLVQMMQFRLVLLPVWLFQWIEGDGDRRTTLVQGQSGQVVLGAAVRASL